MTCNMRVFSMVLFILVFFAGCEETVKISLPDSQPLLVVDGLITNREDLNFIKLGISTDFYDSPDIRFLSDAEVILDDNVGNSELLQHVGDGQYKITTIEGVVGRTYSLRITYDGQLYNTVSYLPPVSEISELSFSFKEASLLGEEGYYVAFSAAKSSEEDENYYRWLLYKNDTLLNSRDDLRVDSDRFINTFNKVELDQRFDLYDTVRLEMYSLTREAYDYYRILNILLNQNGGFLSQVADNPPSNVDNGALGIFQTSAMSTKTIIIRK